MVPDGKVAATSTQTVRLDARETMAVTQTMQVRNAKLWHPEDPQLYWLHTTTNERGRVY